VSTSTLYEPALLSPLTDVQGGGRRHARTGTAVSVAVHGALFAALYFVWSQAPELPPRARTIELTLTRPELPEPLVAPPVKPVPQQRPTPTPPQPQRVRPVTHAAPLTGPATRSAPAPTTPSIGNAPAAPSAAQPVAATLPTAPAVETETAPPKPRVIDTNGIPSDYVEKVFERINRYAADSYPRASRLRHEEGRVAYRLTLDAQGQVVHLDITSSGNDQLDEAAREAIKSAAPFSKPPDLGASAYRLAGTIVYQLTD
jgi:protein TonB